MDDDFFEEDEPVEKIRDAFARGEKGITMWDAAEATWTTAMVAAKGACVYIDEDRWYWRRRWAWLQHIPIVRQRIPPKSRWIDLSKDRAPGHSVMTIMWSTNGFRCHVDPAPKP